MTVPQKRQKSPPPAEESTVPSQIPCTAVHHDDNNNNPIIGGNNKEGHRIDPENWDGFRVNMHTLLDQCIDRMQNYRNLPWKKPPTTNTFDFASVNATSSNNDTTRAGTGRSHNNCNFINPTNSCNSYNNNINNNTNSNSTNNINNNNNINNTSNICNRLVHDIMPYAMGNTHSSFWGWVNGAGIPICLAADIIASTMNSNCGGRNHIASKIEYECIQYLCNIAFGCNNNNNNNADKVPFGVITTGTSQATIIALCTARYKLLGRNTARKNGICNIQQPIRVYAADGVHSCLRGTLEVMGHGSNSLITIPIDNITGSIRIGVLQSVLDNDIANGILPLAVVGVAGSVSIGSFDNIIELSLICKQRNIWLHIDAAFGFWTRIAQTPYCNLINGIEYADSIALDTHKWPGVTYDCGVCLIADKNLQYNTFSYRPPYLQQNNDTDKGLAGGGDDITWFCDYTFEQSRGFRALKLWTVLQSYNIQTLGSVITDNCNQAQLMGKLVQTSNVLLLVHPVISNVCIFTIANNNNNNSDIMISDIATELQLAGIAVFSTLEWNGISCLRAAIVNHRTTSNDIIQAISAVEQLVRQKFTANFCSNDDDYDENMSSSWSSSNPPCA